MKPDGDVKDAGEALLAALAGHSLSAPPSALRDRVIRGALRRERRPVSWWPRPAVIGGAVALVVLLAGALAWGLSANQALALERSLRTQLQDSAGKDEIVFDVVDSRSVAKTTLRSPTDDSPTAPYGKIFTRSDMPYVVGMSGRLPPPAVGLEYHVYLDDRRIGTIAPNDNGFGYFVYRAQAVGISYREARLILEAPQATSAGGTLVLLWSGR